jgi:hypothetical protein
MRCACLLAFAAVLPTTGCTALVMGSGRDPESLTKERVMEEFPAPVVTENSDGSSSITFRTRRKIADRANTIYAAMGFCYTAGLGELITFPNELGCVGRTALFGSNVRIEYSPTGEVQAVSVNGEEVYSAPEPSTPEPAPAVPPAGAP